MSSNTKICRYVNDNAEYKTHNIFEKSKYNIILFNEKLISTSIFF